MSLASKQKKYTPRYKNLAKVSVRENGCNKPSIAGACSYILTPLNTTHISISAANYPTLIKLSCFIQQLHSSSRIPKVEA
jgi:hypothetical protein